MSRKRGSDSNKLGQETLNALSKLKIRIDCLKRPQLLSGSRGAPSEVESSASETESVKIQERCHELCTATAHGRPTLLRTDLSHADSVKTVRTVSAKGGGKVGVWTVRVV